MKDKQDKYYHVINEDEYNWLMKMLGREGYKWNSGYEPKSLPYAQSFDVICIEEDNNFQITHVHFDWFKEHRSGKTLIEVSTLMPQDGKIYMTSEEKREFDELNNDWDSISGALLDIKSKSGANDLFHRIYGVSNTKSLNLKELEFSRAFVNPDLIVVKDPEPRFAYELKDKFQNMLYTSPSDPLYLHADERTYGYPEYHTAEEWHRVDNDIKVAFKRVYEVKK